MSVTRIYTRTGSQDSPGTKIDADIDNTNNEINAHEALTASHGATGAVVGTTNSQTLTNKTITAPTFIGGLKKVCLSYEALAAGSATLNVNTIIAGVTALAADVTVTIPTSEIIAYAGRIWEVKDETGTAGLGFNIIVATEGAETIDGQNTVVISEPYGSIKLYSNGVNCFLVG